MNVIVSVHAEALIARMNDAPDRMRQALRIAVDRLSIQIQRSVKEDKLTGQVLHVRTGTGRRSINREMQERPDGIFATIGTNLGYMIGWENGFTKKVGAGARGGPKSLLGLARDRYFMKHPPGERDVAARPFLRPTLQEFEPQIKEDLRAAALSALRG
jgi:hypothetical protein